MSSSSIDDSNELELDVETTVPLVNKPTEAPLAVTSIDSVWHRLCVVQFVFASFGGMMWLNTNVLLDMVGFFFVASDYLTLPQLNTFFHISVASCFIDYSWIVLYWNESSRLSSSHLSHLSSLMSFSVSCNLLHLLLKHIWLSILFLLVCRRRGDPSDPLSRFLQAFTWWPSLKSLFSLALPSSFSYLLGYSQFLISIVATGKLGPAELGAAGIATMLANVTGSCIGVGLNMALDTLVSNAFGAGKYQLAGRHVQRAIAIQTLLCIPITCIWLNGEALLRFFGLVEVAPLAGQYTRTLIIGLWPQLVNDSIKRYLQAQGVVGPILASSAWSLPMHCLLTYVLVFKTKLAFVGAALAIAISNWNLMLSLMCFTYIRKRYRRHHQQTSVAAVDVELNTVQPAEVTVLTAEGHTIDSWIDASDSHHQLQHSDVQEPPEDPDADLPPLSMDIFRGWGEYFKLGAPAAVSLFFEWGSYECTAWASGLLGTDELAVHTIFMQTVALWYMIPLGVSIAASTLIGNSLGAGDPDTASVMTRVALSMAALYGAINSAIYAFGLPETWIRVFTSDPKVMSIALNTFPILFIYGIFDAIFAVTSGVLRGAGRPTHVAVGNIGACFLVGAPLVYLMAFYWNWRVSGVWLAMTGISLSTDWFQKTCFLLTFVLRSNLGRVFRLLRLYSVHANRLAC
jgi:MATE family multidrug resistance protein